jgi:hypothetical protein
MREWVQLLALAPHPELGFVDHMSRVPPGARNGLRARDPESISAFRVSIAALMAELALHPERVEILDKVVGYHEHILRLYPTNPINHVRMSNILAMQHEQTADARLLRRAANELAIALDLNSQRDPFEVRRFSTEKVAELQSRLAELKGMLEDVESREAKPEDP